MMPNCMIRGSSAYAVTSPKVPVDRGCYYNSPAMKQLQRIGLMVLFAGVLVHSQGGAPARFVTPPAQTIAIRAGRLFDSRAGTLLNNAVVLIKGDRIADVGPA